MRIGVSTRDMRAFSTFCEQAQARGQGLEASDPHHPLAEHLKSVEQTFFLQHEGPGPGYPPALALVDEAAVSVSLCVRLVQGVHRSCLVYGGQVPRPC